MSSSINSKLYITADDFGMSPGINWAINKALHEGIISNASIVANGDCFLEAIDMALSHSSASFGLHFNLDYGKPVSDQNQIPNLLTSKGLLENKFYKYFLIQFSKQVKEYKVQVEIELRAQLEKLNEAGITIDYIDSHRHIHAIPFVNNVVKKVAKEYNIERVRSFNESYFKTLIQSRSAYLIHPTKILKWLVFKILSLVNRDSKDSYFYSILLSSILNKKHAKHFKIDRKYKYTEIMVHVGNPKMEEHFYTTDDLTNRYIREPERYTEYDFCKVLKQRLSKHRNG